MTAQDSLIVELEHAVVGGSKEKRLETLRRVTDLFLIGESRFSEEQIDVFDDVLEKLIERIETKARAELSLRLAPVANAPIDVIRRLASAEEIEVAEPVLQHSPRLSSADLVTIARSKGQGHLLAISRRSGLQESVTDVLTERGDDTVLGALAKNADARFSADGFATFARRVSGNDMLTELLGMRLDLPLKLFKELLLRATEAVRNRLMSHGDQAQRDAIRNLMDNISNDVLAADEVVHDWPMAVQFVQGLKSKNALNEAVVYNLAIERQFPEMVVAIATLASSRYPLVQDLMDKDRADGLLIACRAAGLSWPTVRATLRLHTCGVMKNEKDMEAMRHEYAKLSVATAERVLRFWQVRVSVTDTEKGTAFAN